MSSKKILTALLATGMLFSLSACGNRNKPNAVNHYKTVKTESHKANNRYINNTPVNYKKPSQHTTYPKLNKNNNRIFVSIKHQRAYIQKKSGNKWLTIYTMYASTGSHNRTPRGHYKINGTRTSWFYSPQEHEGAQYATGWKDGGVYLFHSTPANKNHKVYKNVAHDLGRKPSSHGCVHLTIPDAKWIMQKAPTGMQVIIK